MFKKIFGILLLIFAGWIIVCVIINGGLESARETVTATIGMFVGLFWVVGVYVASGILLLTFDRVYKKKYVNGFFARKKQCSRIIAFVVTYAVFLFICGYGAGSTPSDNFLLSFIISALPYFIPGMVFAFMLAYYVLCFKACEKNFRLNELKLERYFSEDETFCSYAEDNSVLASDKVLFLPKTFCVIPIDQIESVRFKDIVIEKDVIINLVTGKKIEIVAGQKTFESIAAAVHAIKSK